MKKQTKLFSTLSAAALLTIGVSAVSMAAGWDNSTGEWRYLNNDGTEVTDTWKSANGNWFYLGSDGVMATNQLIEDTNNSTTRYYYVDQYGAMVRNTWKAVAKDGDDDLNAEYWWYYFGADGKAYTTKNDGNDLTVSKLKTIDGKKYIFNDEGHMMYGWIKKDSLDQNDNDDDAWKDALFFANGWNDGHVQTGWAQITVEDDDETKDYWFWFGDDGKKANDKDKKKINGQYYHFAEDGHMLTEWAVGTQSVEDAGSNASASQIKYLNGDGSERRAKWVWAVPDEHSEDVAQALGDDYDDDEYSWFYYDKKGNPYTNDIKKVNGKKYAFDKYGRMLTGFVAYDKNGGDEKVLGLKKPGDYTLENYRAGVWQYSDKYRDTDSIDSSWEIYFFSNDEEKDGSIKKGYQTLALEDENAQFYFNTNSGVAENGYVKKISKYCVNGLVLSPSDDDDSNYGAIYAPGHATITNYKDFTIGGFACGDRSVEGGVLVNKSGNIIKSKNKLKDNNGAYYIVNKNAVVLAYFGDEDEYDDFVTLVDDNDSTKTKKFSIPSKLLDSATFAELDSAIDQYVADTYSGWHRK